MKRLILLCILMLSPLMVASAAEKGMVSENDLINGVSDFLIERAEANLIYAFEYKIKKSEQFACYFPNTRNRLEYGHLQEWLLFPNKIWKETIEKDMEVFALRSVVVNVEKHLHVSDKATELADMYLTMSEDLVVLYDGQRYPLNVVYNRTQPESQVANGFSTYLGDIVTALNAFRRYTSTCESPAQGYDEFKNSIEGLLKIKDKLTAFENHMKQYGKDLRLATTKIKEFCEKHDLSGDCATEEQAARLYAAKLEKELKARFSETELATYVAQARLIQGKINAVVDKARDTDTYTGMVMVVLDGLNKEKVMDAPEFERLSRAALFFANISDSKSPEGVKAVLKAYTLPPVSYYTKREYGYHVNITAYLGLAYGFYDSDIPEPDEKTSIFAPIGVELSRGLGDGASFSLMLSPFDLGYPVTQRMNGNKSDAELSDILAPSITASYGLADMPFTLGAGYQQGRYIESVGKTETRWLIFIAFDMPLWNIR